MDLGPGVLWDLRRTTIHRAGSVSTATPTHSKSANVWGPPQLALPSSDTTAPLLGVGALAAAACSASGKTTEPMRPVTLSRTTTLTAIAVLGVSA